jgi:putative transposase
MENYRSGAHSVYDLKYHVVWITKYRKAVLHGQIGKRLRELVREICRSMDVEILAGNIRHDHVHMMLSVPPQVAISVLMQRIKGKSSRKLMDEFKGLKKQYWGQHLWARGYFAVTTGNVTDEMVMHYIQNQDAIEAAKKGDNFQVQGGL